MKCLFDFFVLFDNKVKGDALDIYSVSTVFIRINKLIINILKRKGN